MLTVPSLLPLVALAGAGLLALGFHRNRAALMVWLLVLAELPLLIGDWSTRLGGSAPVDLLALGVLLLSLWPERQLGSPWGLGFGLVWPLLAWWLAAAGMLPAPWTPLTPIPTASLLLALAGLVMWARGLYPARLTELTLGLALLLWAAAGWPGPESMLRLAGAGVLMIGVLAGSYRMAFVDALTGLPNRRALDETLARLHGDCALAMADIDHFKKLNDRHGHAAGDRVLQQVAARLRRLRGGRAFRYGGEEFCLVFPGLDGAGAAEVCDQLRQQIATAAIRLGRRGAVKVTVSIGVAERSAQLRQPERLREAADKALYKAKRQGRNQVVRAPARA